MSEEQVVSSRSRSARNWSRWGALLGLAWAVLGAIAVHVQVVTIAKTVGSPASGSSGLGWAWVAEMVVIAALLAALVVGLHRWPLAEFVAVGACALAALVLPWKVPQLTLLAIDPFLLLASAHLGRRARPRVAVVAVLVLLALLVGLDVHAEVGSFRELQRQSGIPGALPVVQVVLAAISAKLPWLVMPVAAGMVVRHQVLEAERALDDLSRERAEQAVRVAEAVRLDRERVAHELHDLAAHHTTAVVINARAARKLAGQQPGVVPELMDSIVDQARDAQSSLRQMVEVLHDPDEPGSRSPQPSLAEIPALVEAARRVNPDIVLEQSQPAGEVPASVALAAYRIVQESLTNCHRHAPGAPVTVVVEPDGAVDDPDPVLLVEVRNGRRRRPVEVGMGGGRGVDGMRMRAELLGGMLEAGPAGNGWAVHAELPLHQTDQEQADQEQADHEQADHEQGELREERA